MSDVIGIGGKRIGEGQACFIVAEAGVNHNGDPELARQLVDVAQRSGADAVKFQTFRASQVVSASAPKAAYQMETTGGTESQLEMIKRLELPFAAFRDLHRYCGERGMLFLSTPFDEESAAFLVELGVAALKVPSGEVTNLPFLRRIGAYRKPVILSTGMCDLGEVEAAVDALRTAGCSELILLHCTSSYPAEPAECNLRAMQTLRRRFGVPVGYSDHTQGVALACAAAALGASIIEKHVTLDRALPGPDHRASLGPEEFRALVRSIRQVEAALGDGVKRPMAGELNTRAVARRSLVASRDLAAGAVLGSGDVVLRRPGTGIAPAELDRVVGRRTAMAVKADEVLRWEHLEAEPAAVPDHRMGSAGRKAQR